MNLTGLRPLLEAWRTCTNSFAIVLLSIPVAHSIGFAQRPDSTRHTAMPPVSARTVGQAVEVSWIPVRGAAHYRVLLDDAPGFVTPILARDVPESRTLFAIDELALVPNTVYYVRVVPPGAETTFVVKPPRQWKDPVVDIAYIKTAWEHAGRNWIAENAGVQWVASANRWRLTPDWPDAPHPADKAYYVEYAALAALNIYDATHDAAVLDELAQFYDAYIGRFTTLGQARAADPGVFDVTMLAGRGDNSARTLITSSARDAKTVLAECDLCTSQFLYPASRLLRMITQVPGLQWTAGMQAFVGDYSTLLLHDHLLRKLYAIKHWQEQLSCVGCTTVDLWEDAAMAKYASLPPARRAFADTYLWYGATIAELLGAHANCPEQVRITAGELSQLKRAIAAHVAFLQSKRTLYADTRTFSGQLVPSASYFNGDQDDLPDNAYSGYSGARPPEPADKIAKPGISWDVSHIHRLPIYFRALYDNRKATALTFPASADIQLIVRQLLCRVLEGDMRLPLFRNFFDGSDGWYRVGYHPGDRGYPPARYCDSGALGNCLASGSLQGWGMLSVLSPELSELEYSLIRLSSSNEQDRVAFRNRYLRVSGQEYSPVDAKGNLRYPALLLWVAAGAAGILAEPDGAR